jgi:hypothetical protein
MLARWMPADPYIGVRADMARVLGELAPRDPSGRAEEALLALATVEAEGQVMRALVSALAALHSPKVVAATRARSLGARGQLWLVGQGQGTLEVAVGGAVHRVPFNGAAMLNPGKAGPVTLRAVDGQPRVAWAYWRALRAGPS